MMLSHPDATIAPFLGVSREIASIVESASGIGALGDADKFEDG
jgi:hypothetical protein